MVSIGPKIQIQGEDSYRLSLRRIIQETKELGSEMDLLTSSFDKNTSALDKATAKHQLYAKQIESAEKEVSKIAEGLEKANKKHQDEIQAAEKQAQSVAKLKGEQERLLTAMANLDKQGGSNTQTYKDLETRLQSVTEELKAEEAALGKANQKVDESGRILADWETTANKAETELNELKKGFEDTAPYKVWGEEIKAAGEKIADFGEKMADVGETMTKYVSAPLTAFGTYAVKAASDFEDGMAKIYTIAVDSTVPMEEMRDGIIRLSNDSGFALDDLAEATYQTVSASVDAADAIDFMTHATDLARAGFTTTTKAVDVLTTIMNSYGKEAYDVEYISDVLLKTQNDGKLIIDELASSLGIIIPMASNYNVGLEQVAAAYATMTKQGVPASKATTFLRAVFTELEKESSDVADILMKKTNKSFAELMGSGEDLSDVLRILYDHVGGNAEKFQRLFGNVRATQAVASLVTDDFKILDTELERVSNSTGQTDKALEQLETPSLKAKRAIAQLKTSSVELGEAFIVKMMPAFDKGTSKVKELTTAFTNLTPQSMDTIINAGLLAAAIGPVMTIGGKLVGYVGALIAGTAPLAPLIAGVTAGVIALSTAMQVSNVEHLEAIKSEHGLTDEMQAQLTKMEEFKTAHADFQASMQERTTATLNEVAYIQDLVTQYDALVGANGKVSEENQATADFIINELASALGMEASQVQELTDKQGKLSTSIQQTITDYQNEAFASVMKEQLIEATRRKVEAERIEASTVDALKEATERANTSTWELTDAQNAIDTAIKNGVPVTQDMIDRLADATAANKLDQDAVNALRGELFEAQTATSDASADIEYYTQKLKENAEQAEKTGKKVESSAKSAETTVKNTAKASQDALDSATKGSGPSGYNFVKGFADSIDANAYLGGAAASRLGSLASRNLNASLQVKSPSRVTAETGKYFVEGFENSLYGGMRELGGVAEKLGMSAVHGLMLGSYLPETGNVYNKTVSAPISINLTVNGSVDDPQKFAREVGDILTKQINREVGVFA